MVIELPAGNHVFDNNIAEIKDGVLYIYRASFFKDIMYQITYMIYGTDCYYCHKKFDEQGLLRTDAANQCKGQLFSKLTMDHLVPQEFGGPTIPNNMRPTCNKCNQLKSNWYPEEFEELMGIDKQNNPHYKSERALLKKRITEIQEKRRYGEIPSIPEGWLIDHILRTIYVNFHLVEPIGLEYKRIEMNFKKYRRILKTIIVSGNGFLLDGFNVILFAKKNSIEKIPTIILENVIYKGFPQ